MTRATWCAGCHTAITTGHIVIEAGTNSHTRDVAYHSRRCLALDYTRTEIAKTQAVGS